jgi:hypothetical protein
MVGDHLARYHRVRGSSAWRQHRQVVCGCRPGRTGEGPDGGISYQKGEFGSLRKYGLAVTTCGL